MKTTSTTKAKTKQPRQSNSAFTFTFRSSSSAVLPVRLGLGLHVLLPLALAVMSIIIQAGVSDAAWEFGTLPQEEAQQVELELALQKVLRDQKSNMDIHQDQKIETKAEPPTLLDPSVADVTTVTVTYGADISFPMQHDTVSTNYPWLPHNVDPEHVPVPPQYQHMPINPLGDKQTFYEQYIQGCVDFYGAKGERCHETERGRFEMSLRQPRSMQNYTELGYKKIKAPAELFRMLEEFWNKNRDKAREETWGAGNTYTNNWHAPSEMVSVEDTSLRGGGSALKQAVWNAARETISDWTGQELTQCSLYGIRVYHDGAVLAPHVDRLPLVSSAIINVAQDVDAPWPLEVIGHDGVAANVTMEPGDMILYESHSVIHGRPFPLQGRFYANIFIHFEPTGHTLRHHSHINNNNMDPSKVDVHKKYRESLERGEGGHEHEQQEENQKDKDGLPVYILRGSTEEEHWRQRHPQSQSSGAVIEKLKSFTTGSTSAHSYAQEGKIRELEEEIRKNKAVVNARDGNGWTPLHESIRAGHLDAVKLLVANGADINVKTNYAGATALWWAKQELGEDSLVYDYLFGLGAIMEGPEL